MRTFRYERFGGIVQLERPRALVFVDRDRARALGYRDQERWLQPPPEGELGLLSAPLEAHLQLTNRCSAGCQGCYTGASPDGAPQEYGESDWRRVIDALAAQGVFHLALGGGESALLPWLGDLARYARARGLVPNLTTSGLYSDHELERLIGWAPLFGQINVSLDGIGDGYRQVRGVDGFAQADRAIVRLRKVHKFVGINCVVTRQNFDSLAEIFGYVKKRKLREIELLRFKPSGRGRRVYESLRCTDAQHRSLLPAVLKLARRHRLRVRLDCSYTPMIAHHRVKPELMAWLGVYGCAGGDLLVAAKATGALTACSFAAPTEVRADRIADYWQRPDAFSTFRQWRSSEEPCRSCDYLKLCRGGCRVVSAHTLHDAARPDPECPRVVDFRAQQPVRLHLPLVADASANANANAND